MQSYFTTVKILLDVIAPDQLKTIRGELYRYGNDIFTYDLNNVQREKRPTKTQLRINSNDEIVSGAKNPMFTADETIAETSKFACAKHR